jgi:hypothetical protein
MTTHPTTSTTHPTQRKEVVGSNGTPMVNGCDCNDNGKVRNHSHCNDNDNHHDGNPQPQLQYHHHQTPTPPQVSTGTKTKPNSDTIVQSPSLTTLEVAEAMECAPQPSQQQSHRQHQCTPITVASDRVHYTDNVIRSNYTYVRSLYCSKTPLLTTTDRRFEVSYKEIGRMCHPKTTVFGFVYFFSTAIDSNTRIHGFLIFSVPKILDTKPQSCMTIRLSNPSNNT